MKYLMILLTAGVLYAQYVPITEKEKREIKQYNIETQKMWDTHYTCIRKSKSDPSKKNCKETYNARLEELKLEYKDYITKFTKKKYERKFNK